MTKSISRRSVVKREFETAILPETQGNIQLFRPHIPKNINKYLELVLNSRWIGQGPQVSEFERRISNRFCRNLPGVAVGSGTDALHLAYILAGVKAEDEVLVPVFTCTATSIPLLYLSAKPIFVDINSQNMNLDVNDLENKITNKTKAITVVHYSGLPCDMDEIRKIANKYKIPVIEDAAHALGAEYNGEPVGSISDFTIFSFQAIKHITTGDGGYLSIKNPDLLEQAKRLRWFGIDRQAKQDGVWDNDITEIGYKYQMTDLSAAFGLAGLDEIDEILDIRLGLFNRYLENLESSKKIRILDNNDSDKKKHAHWMLTIGAKNRREIQKGLFENGIESSQVHFRNDRYSIFSKEKQNLKNMDAIEDDYLVLPMHTSLTTKQIDRICAIVLSYA